MKMRRKGFLAALVAGIISPAVALGKGKPKFPRYFVWADGEASYYRADSAKCIRPVGPAYSHDCVLVCNNWKPCPPGYARPLYKLRNRPFTIDDAERCVARGEWREITAAEAEALLKPKKDSPETVKDMIAFASTPHVLLAELDRAVIDLWDKTGRHGARFTLRASHVRCRELMRLVGKLTWGSRRLLVPSGLKSSDDTWYLLSLPTGAIGCVKVVPDHRVPPDRYYITVDDE